MLHDNGVRTAHQEATRHFALIYRTGFHAGGRLDVNTFVIHRHLAIYRVLLLAVMTADHSFFYRPWQTTFVRFKSSGKQFLLFGQRGLGGLLRLLANHLVDLLVQFSHTFLLLLELLVQVFLFALQLVEHVLLLALVAFEVFLLAFAAG